ncbi:MAG TPA: TonB-dependent receptor plug domain-containing protein, partial [Gammaproteobacteria bacterium]|nr:TonB-dependent receptor plug domain-containing protein [Gammaproteobacteria bacterium]
MNKTLLGELKRGALPLAIAAVLAASASGPRAYAQDAAGPAVPNAGQGSNPVEEVVVTGSRVRQATGMLTPTPVTAVTPAELSSFEPGGTVADQLNSLPQFFGNRSAESSPGAMRAGSGSSFLNMRDLGPNRTLVLFDGSRMVPADINGSVDIDTFPTALIRSVDVVTGGASAAYGADALGGVTNFVLNREFEGLKINAGTGVTEFGDG